MEYKIGDVVRIKYDLQLGEKYGMCKVTKNMLDYRGTLQTIEYIDPDGDLCLSDNTPCVWDKNMVELVKDNLEQSNCVNEVKEVDDMKYKIGDVVRIKDDIQEGEKYGELYVMDYMLPFRGTIDIIENIDEDGDYHLANNKNPYMWSEEMLEPIGLKDDLKEEMKEKNNMGYEIGDVVMVKENLQEGEKYGECNVIKDMLKFRGVVDVIKSIDIDGDFYLENNPYIWNKDMLESFASPEGVTLSSDLKSVKMDRLGIYEYILNHLEETYRDKNNDYGNSVSDTYDKFGCVSFLVRITDKYNRLMTLCNPNAPEQKVKDEKIDDTILDLANYCLLWLVEREYRNQ